MKITPTICALISTMLIGGAEGHSALVGRPDGLPGRDQPEAKRQKGAQLEKDNDPPSSGRVPAGSVVYRIKSGLLDETRRVFVATPPSYAKTSRRYPVILAFDGEYIMPEALAAAAYLAEEGQIPEAIVVGIANTNRLRDLTPPGLSVSGSTLQEGGDRFLDFVEGELLPALEGQFRFTKPYVLVGHSSGAILATYAAATRGNAFPFCVALDVPAHLGDHWLAAKLTESAVKGMVPPLRYASLEARFGWSEKSWLKLQTAAPKSWRLLREKLPNESHTSMRWLGVYLGLRHVFNDYSMIDLPDMAADEALNRYKKLQENYGAAQTPPRRYLVRLLEEQMAASRALEARVVFDAMTAAYGEPTDGPVLKAKIADIASRPPPKETVESLLKTPRPTPEQAKKFRGAWRGHHWFNDSPKQPIELRVFVDDGSVKTELVYLRDPDNIKRKPGEYLRITDAGLEFGHLNGIDPKGVIIFEGRLRGDILEGDVKIRGIEVTPPSGSKLPVHQFLLERSGGSERQALLRVSRSNARQPCVLLFRDLAWGLDEMEYPVYYIISSRKRVLLAAPSPIVARKSVTHVVITYNVC
jgi:hypothetical protein